MKLRLALLLALGCAHAPDPPRPAPAADPLPAIRADVDALLAAQGAAYWAGWTTGAPVDVAASYRGRERILDPASLAAVQAALAAASGDERRALGHLWAFLAGERLAFETRGASGRLAAAEARATFPWDGREVPEQHAWVLLAAEPSAERRAALEKAHAAAAARLAPLVEAEARAVREAARRLGYPDSLALAGELRGEPAGALAALADAMLGATEEPYRALLESLARSELGVPLAAVRARDLPRLFHTAHDPRAFPAARLAADGGAALAGLGLDLGKLPGLTLDLAPRAGKDPRPLAIPVQVPGDVRLSALPAAGAEEARAFLRELGAAVYYVHVRTPVMEFRRLGPSAAAGVWSRLLAGLAADPAWLAERAGLSGHALARELRAAEAERLQEARLAAARLLLAAGRPRDPARAAELRSRLLSRALDRPVEPGEADLVRLDPDPLLHSAETLRSICLAAEVEAFLARRAGGPWWRSRESGQWLARAWADGSRPTAEELAAAAGEKALSPAAFAARARARVEEAAAP